MSEFNRLREITQIAALLRPRPVQIEEAQTLTAGFDGVKSIVEGALGDLEDKLGKAGALELLLNKHGLSDLDNKKDKNGETMLERLQSKTEAFKKEVEDTLLELELMIASSSKE